MERGQPSCMEMLHIEGAPTGLCLLFTLVIISYKEMQMCALAGLNCILEYQLEFLFFFPLIIVIYIYILVYILKYIYIIILNILRGLKYSFSRFMPQNKIGD